MTVSRAIYLPDGSINYNTTDFANGIEQGMFITELATPGQAVRITTSGVFRGNNARDIIAPIANIPATAADATNERIDIVQGDAASNIINIKDGTPAVSDDSNPVPPAPDTGFEILRYIKRRANNNVILRNDDGVNSFLYGFNFQRFLPTIRVKATTSNPSFNATTFTGISEMEVAVYLKRDSVIRLQFSSNLQINNANTELEVGFFVNGSQIAGATNLSEDNSIVGRATANSKTFIYMSSQIRLAAGAYKIVVKGFVNSGSVTFLAMRRKMLFDILGET